MFLSYQTFPYEQSKTFLWVIKICFWAIINFLMSNQKHSYSIHNMFLSNQTCINLPCEWSEISLWAIKNILMSDQKFPYEWSKAFLWAFIICFWAIKHFQISFMSNQRFPHERSKIFLWVFIICFWVIKHVSISLVSDQRFPYERSKTFLWVFIICFWAIINFLMSNQKYSYEHS